MDVPDTLGHILFLAFIAMNLNPAFRNGFSFLPAPAAFPMVALQVPRKVRSFLEGSKMVTFLPCFASILAAPPEVLTNLPPSPGVPSMLKMSVPSGMSSSGTMFPDSTAAPFPITMVSLTAIPSGACISFFSPFCLNSTSGVECPAQCTISVTCTSTFSASRRG